MGILAKGEWHADPIAHDFAAALEYDSIQNWLSTDDSAGPTGEGGFKAEADRYHLYVSSACPFAHRALIYRNLKGLAPYITVSSVNPKRYPDGWDFSDGFDDPINGWEFLRQAFVTAKSDFTGRVTVPVLWDKQRNTMVNCESGEIIQMFDTAFSELTGDQSRFRPPELSQEIDALNEFIQDNINAGVYKCGFAKAQSDYDQAFGALFSALDAMETRLSKQRYLHGLSITETDWRLFTTLVRFDPVYYVHFKTNKYRIEDYPNLSNYFRDLYQQPGVAETIDIEETKLHYYYTHDFINPTRFVPQGPALDWSRPHNRERFTPAANETTVG
jgi:putative glutathione S-transferase